MDTSPPQGVREVEKVKDFSDLIPAAPEIFMAVAAMALLMFGVFRRNSDSFVATIIAVAAMAVAGVLLLVGQDGMGFHGMFIADSFAVYAKILVLIGSAVTLGMARGYMQREEIYRFEYPVLVLLATLGMMMMISAANFMSLYMGLELQSLALYVLAAYQRDSSRSTESGVKYYILGSLASGLMLYGISLVYGFSGTVDFADVARTVTDPTGTHIGVVVGMVFILAGLAFKVAAVPFHMWTPDVYEGAPTPITAFFSIAPKVAAMALFVRVMVGPFGGMVDQWRQVVVFISILSMILGSLAAIPQSNIKRLMAYSSIGHVGYLLVGLAAGTVTGVQGILFYLTVYLFMNVGTFVVILSMRQRGRTVEGIEDLAGLSKTNPLMAGAMAIFMFSMAGIPPMAGFWGKFYIFKAAVDANMITLAVIGILTSVIGAYYYLRIVKIMYFDEPADSFDRPVGGGMVAIMGVCALMVMLITIIPAQLVAQAGVAASVLFR